MTIDEYDALVRGGIVGPVWLNRGRVVMAGREMVFSPEQARAAAALGVHVRSLADVVLADPELRAELRRRFASDDA